MSADTDRLARVAALRETLATDADCAAMAQRIDDQLCALGMRLCALHPEKRDVTGRQLNSARIALADTLRFLGIDGATNGGAS